MFNGLRKHILPLAFIYWISPIDLLPLIPVDDIFVVAFALVTYFVTGNSNLIQNAPRAAAQKDDEEDVITTSWSVVEEEQKEE